MTQPPLSPAPAGSETPPEAQETAPNSPEHAPLPLRVSMVFLAGTVIAFTYFTPLWMDRGLTKVNHDRLYNIAEDTAQRISANNWDTDQGKEYALRQTRLGNLETTVEIAIEDAGVTVTVSGSAASANPFAPLTGAAPVNRIEVAHTHTN